MFRRARDIFIGAVIGVILVGGVMSAVAFNDVDLFKAAPFSFQDLWIMKQARVILETYHVDGEEGLSEEPSGAWSLRWMTPTPVSLTLMN